MPTANPRTQVTLSPHLDLLVVELARLQRVSKSQVLRELFEAAEPALRRAVALMQAASMASQALRSTLRESIDHAQDRAERALDLVMEEMDTETGNLLSEAESIRSRRPARKGLPSARAPSGVAKPPLSNRGVRNPKRGKTGG